MSLVAQTQMGEFIMGAETGTYLGHDISMPDAQTVAVSTPKTGDEPGFVQVFEWNGSDWVQKGNDFISDPLDVRLGTGISMPDANTIAMAAVGNDDMPGFIQVYDWDGNEWQQRGENIFCASSLIIWSKTLTMPDLNTLAISGMGLQNGTQPSGTTQVFEWDGNEWVQKGENIESSDPDHLYGYSAHMPSASTIAISAYWGSSDEIDIAKVYEWDGTNWVQKGNPIIDTSLGTATYPVVNMPSDNTIAVGIPRLNFQGMAAVYDWDGSDWSLRDEPMTYHEDYLSWSFGCAVSMPDETTLAVGDYENWFPIWGDGIPTGMARAYHWDGTEWVVRADMHSEVWGGRAGHAVSMGDANHIAISAPHATSPNGLQSGFVMVFQLEPVGIDEQQPMSDFVLYPNPTNGPITLDFQGVIDHAIITLLTIDGRIVDSQSVFGATSFRYDLQEPSGMYFVQVALPTGAQKTLRVIKQ